ncbi:MAG: hypothetical protein LBD75_02030 [Candidatus Peribacteria bacterium]|nr:hypothetical protein [Candidatus Peribacteria bacterium]
MHFLEIHGFYMTDDYFILEDKVIYKDKVVAGINANEFKKAIGYEYNYNLYVKVGNIVIKDGEIIKDLKGDDIEDLSKNQYDKYIRRENALLYDGHIVEGIEIQDSKDFELIEPAERFENYYARI